LALLPLTSWLRAADSNSPAASQGSAPNAADFAPETLRLLKRHHVRPAIRHGDTLPLGYGVLLEVRDPAKLRFLVGTKSLRSCGAENFGVIVRPDATVVGFEARQLSPTSIVVQRVGEAVVVIDFRESVMTWLTLE
jgi:hypothetical protein